MTSVPQDHSGDARNLPEGPDTRTTIIADDDPVAVVPLEEADRVSLRGDDGTLVQADRPQRDWRWIEEWREGDEPTPWGPGLAIAAFVATVVGSAVYVISEGLADSPWFALIANIVVVAGLTPALWLSRHLPVLRWVSLGGAVGVAVAWIIVLVS